MVISQVEICGVLVLDCIAVSGVFNTLLHHYICERGAEMITLGYTLHDIYSADAFIQSDVQ